MNPAKILLVEDDQFLQELYQDVLKTEGYNVDVASDGEEAYAKIQHGGWDLVLMDIIMPKMSGLDVMKKVVSENKPNLYKSTVFLTNLDSDQERKEALTVGKGYVIKSQITPGNLIEEVKKYLTV